MTDLRLVLRSLAKSPLFALLIVATLATGVGATTATFTYVATFLWDSITPDPDTLLQLRYRTPATGDIPQPISYLDFQDFRREASDVGEVAAWWIWGQGVQKDDGTAAFAWGHSVSDGYLHMVRAKAAAGRLLGPDDHRAGASRAVVLGYRFWRRHYDLSSEAIRQTLRIGGERYEIAGVTHKSFLGTGIPADLYIPIQYTRDGAPEWDGTVRDPGQIWGGRVWAMVRLAESASHERARGRLNAVAEALDRSHPLDAGMRELDLGSTVDNGNAELFLQGALRLLGAACLLLLLANANVANLLVTRYLQRRRQLSILAALGASVRRISSHLVAEMVVLSLLGGALGIAFSRLLVSTLRRILIANPIDMGHWGEGAEHSYLALDWRIVAFALATSLATTLLFGLLPALHAARVDVASGLKAAGTGSGPGGTRARGGLVAAQVALAVVLLAGAGLLTRSLQNIWRVDVGFDHAHLVIATLAIAHEGGAEPDLRAAFQEARDRAATIAGVEQATLTDAVPLWGGRRTAIAVPGTTETVEAIHQVVGSSYFETLRQPLLRGRGLDLRDAGDAPLVAVVNQELARQLWPDADPLGQTLRLDISRLKIADQALVVGVAADAQQDLKRPASPHVYLSAGQVPRARMSLLLRTAVQPDSMIAAIREDLSRAHPRLAIVNVATFERHLESRLFEERLYATMGGMTASLGLFLAAAGIFSVLAYIVRSRSRDTAIRMALGANPRNVLVGTLREIAGPVALGAGVGVAAAIATTRLLRSMLFGIDALDPFTLAAAPAVVLLGAVLAGLGPSLRASRTNPMRSLREE